LWAEKRASWCFFEIGDENELRKLKKDKIWHQIIDGPFNTLEQAERSYDKQASNAKPTRILGHGTLYYLNVGNNICFIGRNHNDQITDEPIARINPSLERFSIKEDSEDKLMGWMINIKVINKDKNGEGITGTCIKRAGHGFTCEAEELGDGNYRLGPIKPFLNQKYRTIDLLATVYFAGKGVNLTRYNQPKTVELGESQTVFITFEFSFSKQRQEKQKPSFISDSHESRKIQKTSDDKKPSFIEASTSKTKHLPPPLSIQKPVNKQIHKKIDEDQSASHKDPQKRQENTDKEKEEKAVKLTYEQCIKKFCPMCMFLFGKRPTLDDLPEDECGRCMKSNKGSIEKCLEENK
jgi:hypothetical protein